ncbi:hypothetical protein R5W23_005937 [Gemmata sp. JC673]|uniref:SMI1/KNR4 family protein n=1 Tax=Gemmata algarum TaxID=2975278 RepID=A0ABU5EWD1_9BACT|nr:hypothetical protein [Gemmata algarum]MDY3558780.1 hypothetical protein [Gemmata algarum]
MTEAEWQTATVLNGMVDCARLTASERKFRLFGCACCWRLKDDLPYGCAERIAAAEQLADGDVSEAEYLARFAVASQGRLESGSVRGAGRLAVHSLLNSTAAGVKQTGLATASARALIQCKWQFGKSYHTGQHSIRFGNLLAHEQAQQCVLFRDIFGNPFRPVTFSPEWRTDTTAALAAQMYESRDFGAMPVLADALQDAGCDSDDILNHCRGPGPHVRGCWVVDLVLEKG